MPYRSSGQHSSAGEISAVLRRLAMSPAPAVVAGTLMLALAGYFGTLA